MVSNCSMTTDCSRKHILGRNGLLMIFCLIDAIMLVKKEATFEKVVVESSGEVNQATGFQFVERTVQVLVKGRAGHN